MGGSEIRTRQRKTSRRLRRPATPHACGFLQSYGDARWRYLLAATTGALQNAAVCDGSVPFGISRAAQRARLRSRTRQERTTRNHRLFRSISRGVKSAPPADRRTSHEEESKRSRRRANRRAQDSTAQARTLTGGDATASPADGRSVRESAGA